MLGKETRGQPVALHSLVCHWDSWGAAAGWSDGSKVGPPGHGRGRVRSVEDAQNCPCKGLSAEFGTCPGNDRVSSQPRAPGQMPDSFQELGAEREGLLQQPGSSCK